MASLSDFGVGFLVAGYLVIITFFVIQRFLRKTEGAKSFHGGAYDRGNMVLIGSATALGLWLPIIAAVLGFTMFEFHLALAVAALAFMLLGVALRIWAAVTLGAFYTTTLMIADGQKVITSGPYAWVRNPGYLGEILLWSAFGVLSDSLIVAILLPVMFVTVYLYRISAEEAMLAKELGDDYLHYQKRTRKLVPFVY